MDIPWAVLCQHEREALKLGAAREHGVELAVLHGAMYNPELLQADEGRREAGGVREPAEAEPEAAEGRASEEAGGRTPITFLLGPGAVDDDEVVNVLVREGGEPGSDDVGNLGSEARGGEAGGGDGARVGGERGSNGGRNKAVVVEAERGGGPEAAPAGGEGGGAGSVLGGEAGDDVAEDRVGEGADAVLVVRGGGGGGKGCGGGNGGWREVGEDGGEGFLHGGGDDSCRRTRRSTGGGGGMGRDLPEHERKTSGPEPG